ncbi:MAG: glycosyltransferase [Butyrivibrio sp.]|nr:glycosyltransferase [Butyrivibrio sp.]
MRIGIDAQMVGDVDNERAILDMLDTLVPDKGDEYYLFVQRDVEIERYQKKFKVVHFKNNNALMNNLFELTRFCNKYDLDILHTQYFIPFIRPCHVVCSMQDIPSDNDKMGTVGFLKDKVLIPFSARHADKIVTGSYSSKEDIAETYNINGKKIEVMSNSGSSAFRIMKRRELGVLNVRKKYNIGDDPYILCDGNIDRVENLSKLLKAYVMYRHSWDSNVKLVIIGDNAWMDDEAYDEAMEYEDSIIFTGRTRKEDVVALLNEANGYVHPTSIDDYGVSPLEAMNCGAPVAVAETSDAKRILGDKVIYFDIDDDEDFCEGICNLIYEPIEPARIDHTRKDGGELLKKIYRKAMEEM